MSHEEATGEGYERGWEALRGLAGRVTSRLERLQGEPAYTPISPWVVVRVDHCPFCDDGGLRMAGYLTHDRHLLPVRQCDTCGAVGIGARFYCGDLDGADIVVDAEDDAGDAERDWRRHG